MKKKWSLSLLTLINIIIVGFLFIKYGDHIEAHRLMQKITEVSPALIATLFVFNLTLMFFYGCRLSHLINERLAVGFGIAAVGYAANNLLPLRLGEFFRVYFSQKKYQVPASRSLLAILFERTADLFALGILTLITILASADRIPVSKNIIIIGLMSPFALLAFTVLQKNWKQKFKKNTAYLLYIQPIVDEYQKLFDSRKLSYFLSYTLLIWIFTVLTFFVFFRYNLTAIHFSLIDAICLTVCTSLSLALSTLPSSIGLFEGGIVFYLHVIKNVDETSSLALALIFHCLILIPQVLCMFYFLISKYKATAQNIEFVNLQESS